jgi:phage tail protein X
VWKDVIAQQIKALPGLADLGPVLMQLQS